MISELINQLGSSTLQSHIKEEHLRLWRSACVVVVPGKCHSHIYELIAPCCHLNVSCPSDPRLRPSWASYTDSDWELRVHRPHKVTAGGVNNNYNSMFCVPKCVYSHVGEMASKHRLKLHTLKALQIDLLLTFQQMLSIKQLFGYCLNCLLQFWKIYYYFTQPLTLNWCVWQNKLQNPCEPMWTIISI